MSDPSWFFASTGLWLAVSLVAAMEYLGLAVRGGRETQTLMLAVAFPLQVVVVAGYAGWRRFASRPEAVIRCAAAGAAWAGVVMAGWALAAPFFGVINSPWVATRSVGPYPLQPGYVGTVLLLSGLAGGSALGGTSGLTIGAPAAGVLRRYLGGAVLWLALWTLMTWIVEAENRAHGVDGWNALVLYGIGGAVGGLLFIAPLAGAARVETGASWGRAFRRIIKRVVVGSAGLAFVLGVVTWGWFYGLLAALPLAAILLVPGLGWAGLETWAAVSGPAAPGARSAGGWALIWSAGGSLAALYGGVVAATPRGFGLSAAGCLYPFRSEAEEYWYWKGYQGVVEVGPSGSTLLYRPAVDRSVCLSMPVKDSLPADSSAVSGGLVGAARAWVELVPEAAWDSPRAREIRARLTGLVGRDFPSYAALREWWDAEGHWLVWTGSGAKLVVDSVSKQVRRLGSPSVLLAIEDDPGLYGPDLRDYPQSRSPKLTPSWPYLVRYPSLFFDREARLRGLVRRAAHDVAVLSGEGQRRVLARLAALTGQHFDHKAEWRAYLSRPVPAGDERWESARALGINELCDDQPTPGTVDPSDGCPLTALRSLRVMTGLTYQAPADWVAWWARNAGHLALSADGRRLVVATL